MVIEWLGFSVKPELREKFIAEDARIWTSALAAYEGFLGKEIWIDPAASDKIYLIIRWQTKEQWQAVPIDLLRQTEIEFAGVMGADNYEMIEGREYQIRKFP